MTSNTLMLQRRRIQSFDISFQSFSGITAYHLMHRDVVQDATEGHSHLSSTLILITITLRVGAASWAIVDFSPALPQKTGKGASIIFI